jgi:hypothetical protein
MYRESRLGKIPSPWREKSQKRPDGFDTKSWRASVPYGQSIPVRRGGQIVCSVGSPNKTTHASARNCSDQL